jgi:Ca2+-binding RTX toxin-like protein
MTMPTDPNAFKEDGTPRRRYEIDDADGGGKTILRSSVGIVLANAFILIKNILFQQETARFSAPTAVRAAEASPAPLEDTVAAVDNLPEVSDSDMEPPDLAPTNRKGSSTLVQSEAVDYEPEDVMLKRRSSSMPVAGNDNEALYGAAPGAGISIFVPRDSIPGSAHGDGAGGSAGDETDEDDDDADDDTSAPSRNRLPVVTAPVVLSAAFANQTVSIAFADLLRHASDPDGDTLHVRQVAASSGKVEQRADGSFIFTPVYGDTSNVTFTYRVSDGSGSVQQVATMDLLPSPTAPIMGTATSDALIGTPQSDVILALAGDDLVLGRESSDVIYGGDGDDRIVGGDGDDVIYGEGGNDVIFAGPGNDRAFGGPGDDQIFGEEDEDVLLGEEGNDTISGGDDDDSISGGVGNDKLRGDGGNDLIQGDAGSDDIEGGDGDDVIIGGEDQDLVDAGTGNDIVIALALDGDDTYDGGDGSDTYDLSATTADAVIDLDEETASSADIGNDSIANFENVQGGGGDDVIVANEKPNDLGGGLGEDLFVFRSSSAIGLGSGYRDRILDFEIGDRIDLDDISEEFAEAYEDTFEDQGIKKFVLIREQDVFTRPGQIKLQYEQSDDGGEVSVLAGNTDYDSDPEFELEFAGSYEVTDRDFNWHA